MDHERYDSLTLDWRLCQLMLFLNAIWDFVSCAAIWYSFCVKDVQALVTPAEDAPPPQPESEEAATAVSMLDFIKGFDIQNKIRDLGWRKAVCLSVAEMHTSMWARKGDTFNHAACMLMAWWVLTLGLIRLYAAFYRDFIVLAVYSYAMEGLFFLAEAFKSTMDPKKACYTSIFCFVCMLVCVIKIPR
jgi:hypothetical protein